MVEQAALEQAKKEEKEKKEMQKEKENNNKNKHNTNNNNTYYYIQKMNTYPASISKIENNISTGAYDLESNYSNCVAQSFHTFDYLLLCNKICGASHYNMQMKIVVDTPEDFKKWLAEKPTVTQVWKDANAPAPVQEIAPVVVIDSAAVMAQVIK